MRRGESIFELGTNANEEVERGFEQEGSTLSGVSARCQWVEQDFSKKEGDTVSRIVEEEQEQIRATLQKGLQFQNTELERSGVKEDGSLMEPTELMHVKKLEGVHLIFNLEAGSLLPLAIRYTLC